MFKVTSKKNYNFAVYHFYFALFLAALLQHYRYEKGLHIHTFMYAAEDEVMLQNLK